MGITLRSLVLASLVCAASFARAGFTSVAYLDGSYDATQPLQNGTVYFVTNSIEITGAYDGKSGLAVAPGAEVVIFVQVRSSPTLPIPTDAPETTATLETLEGGGKALVVPFNPTAPSMFYRIEVGD